MVLTRMFALSAVILGASGQFFPADCDGCPSAETDISQDPELKSMFAEHDRFDLRLETLKLAEQMGVNVRFQQFEPIRYRVQPVSGTNYFVRVQLGPDSFADVYVHEPLDDMEAPEVLAAEFNRGPEDPIDILTVTSPLEGEVDHPVEDCPGCRSDEQAPTDDVLQFFAEHGERLRRMAEQEVQAEGLNQVFTEFTPVRFAEQWVAGRKLFVKVRVDKNTFIDIEVFEPPVRTGENVIPQIWGVKPDVKEDAPIDDFDGSMLRSVRLHGA